MSYRQKESLLEKFFEWLVLIAIALFTISLLLNSVKRADDLSKEKAKEISQSVEQNDRS